MKSKDLIKGEIYYCKENPGWNDASYIFKNDGENKGISIKIEKEYFSLYGDYFTNFKDHRLATYEEKRWLEECIKQNKWIPKPKELDLSMIEIY